MKNLLPPYFKIIGIATVVISLAFLILEFSFPLLFKFDDFIFREIFENLILIGTALIAFSKQKKETKEIKKLRLFRLSSAFLFGFLIYILDVFFELIFPDGEFQLKSAYEILLTTFLFFIVIFHHDIYKRGLNR